MLIRRDPKDPRNYLMVALLCLALGIAAAVTGRVFNVGFAKGLMDGMAITLLIASGVFDVRALMLEHGSREQRT